MEVPEIIDTHIHLTRDRAQEKVVFPKSGYPDDWYWANAEGIIPYMDREGISYVFAINYMDTHRMTERRLARLLGASEMEIKEAEQQIEVEMVWQAQPFQNATVELCS